ncbi:tyrosine-type recombinase/integrase [Acidimicrobiaceae bacterium USS-CC1]|uniref:Tyrosine-type recombinase/integrase n=1 Tax=Acidiferrimicrobium australe TaxID=2664430 RepID=A0ABW9QNH2_9ACTN|nr:tyrosine-type recombinase/integrase [Acidiferrimicrobium australe]
MVADRGDEFERDVWDLRRLRLHHQRCPRTIRFDDIPQDWLREAVKRWIRLRLGRWAATTVVGNSVHLRAFAAFVALRHPEVQGPGALTRAVLEDYMLYVARPPGEVPPTKALSSLGIFLDDCRRHEWLALADSARIYRDDFPRKPLPLPRALDESVMAALEHPDNIVQLPDDGTRCLVVVMMRTGLRAGDLVTLPFDPLVFDHNGAPFLRFFMGKMRKDHRLPVDDVVAGAVRAQQDLVRFRFPGGSPWLFPRLRLNTDGRAHYSTATIGARLRAWTGRCAITDATGAPVKVTTHQFRHTLGTRMINQGVPQHVVQEILGHESPSMTAHYARLHDSTLRAAFDAYSAARVDITGRVVSYDPAGEMADGQWMKERLARARQTLPNGYCGRPLQHECPHPNACLTCPDFLTDAGFLDAHRDQLGRTRTLIATARANGQFRMVEINSVIATNLERMVTTLESLEEGGRGD